MPPRDLTRTVIRTVCHSRPPPWRPAQQDLVEICWAPAVTEGFYESLAPHYHLLFEDWDASMRRQGTELDTIIRAEWGSSVHTILDAAAGIGTQAIALASLGYEVTASDRSVAAVERCRREAARRGLRLPTAIADLRSLSTVHGRFDLVLACDNALPHLLSDAEISVAFTQCFRCTVPGGGCLISVRDYPEVPPVGTELHPHGVRDVGGARIVVYQVWTWDGPFYDLAVRIMEDTGASECPTRIFRSRYYAVPVSRLLTLMREAGFEDVRRIDGTYYQPVLVGTRARAI